MCWPDDFVGFTNTIILIPVNSIKQLPLHVKHCMVAFRHIIALQEDYAERKSWMIVHQSPFIVLYLLIIHLFFTGSKA